MKRFELSCRIFLHSLLVYMVLTLPAIYIMPIFVISIIIAFLYGLIAVVVFWFCFTGLWRMDIQPGTAYQFLLVSVIVAVLTAFEILNLTLNLALPGVFAANESAWNSGPFLALPFLAIIAGWIGIYRSRKRVLKQFLTKPYASLT